VGISQHYLVSIDFLRFHIIGTPYYLAIETLLRIFFLLSKNKFKKIPPMIISDTMTVAEKTIIVPDMQKIDVPAVVGSNYKRSGYTVEVSPTLARYNDGSFVGQQTEEQALNLLAEQGFTLPTMALISYLSQAREGKDSYFKDAFAKNKEKTYYWEHTATRLTPPEGKESYFLDSDGRYVGLVCEYNGKEFVPIAEQRIPAGGGNVVIETEPATGIPLKTMPDMKVEHSNHTHWYFDPNLKENIVLFGGGWCGGELGGCFGADADYGPLNAGGGFRQVRGSFGVVEKLAKSYENGLREGETIGMTKGLETGRAQILNEIAAYIEGLKK
jgi:hypothetical protein